MELKIGATLEHYYKADPDVCNVRWKIVKIEDDKIHDICIYSTRSTIAGEGREGYMSRQEYERYINGHENNELEFFKYISSNKFEKHKERMLNA